eukprot:scaffold197414_cov37-Tisochrysis_lutea.AAC.1
MSPKTVCIVGVAGFIGSHMLEKIIREKDWNVIGVDMVAPNKIQQLLGAEKKWASRFEFHQVCTHHRPQPRHTSRARVRSREGRGGDLAWGRRC